MILDMEATGTSKKRTYDDGCAAAHALDLVGERMGVAGGARVAAGAQALHGSQGGGLSGASPNVLARRLRGLGEAGVVRRRKLPPPAASRVYEVTDWGIDWGIDWGVELEPVLTGLGRWGAGCPSMPRDAAMGVDSLVLSFRTMFDQRAAAEGLAARYELRLGEDRFRAEIADGRFEISRGSAERPDAIIETDPGTLAGLIYDDRTLAEAMRSGGLEVTGDRSAFERFLGLFPLPSPAALVGRT